MAKFDKLPKITQWAFIAAITNQPEFNHFKSGQDIDIHLIANDVELNIEQVFNRMIENMNINAEETAKDLVVNMKPSISEVLNKLYHIQSELEMALNNINSAIEQTYNE